MLNKPSYAEPDTNIDATGNFGAITSTRNWNSFNGGARTAQFASGTTSNQLPRTAESSPRERAETKRLQPRNLPAQDFGKVDPKVSAVVVLAEDDLSIASGNGGAELVPIATLLDHRNGNAKLAHAGRIRVIAE